MNGYVFFGWALTLGSLALYSIRTIWRGRTLAKYLSRSEGPQS